MKGIRKLFFGLILMTLIGVGFKIDAKATVTPFIAYGEGSASNWSASDTYIDGYIIADDTSDFSTGGTEYKCQLFCNTSEPYGISQEVTILLKDNGDGTYSYENITTGVSNSCTLNSEIHFYDKPVYSGNEVIRTGISSCHALDKPATINETVFSGVKSGGVTSYSKDRSDSLGHKSETVNLSKVLGGVYEGNTCKYALNCITKDSDDNTYNHSVQTPDNYVYLFPKENVTFKKSNTPATPYQYIAWTWDSDDTVFGTFIDGAKQESTEFSMKNDLTYVKARYGILTFNSTIKANRGSASTKSPVSYSLLGYNNGHGDILKVEIETSSGTYTDVTSGTTWTTSNRGMEETGSFTIATLPTNLSVGSYPLRITMKSDNGVGGGVFNSTIEIINDEKEIVLNDVKVTNSKSITLDNFIKSTSTGSSGTSVKAELYGNAGQYVSSSDLNALKVISSIAVTGTNTTTGVEGIRVSNEGGTNSAKVIVYPLPAIALASGSSNAGTISLGSNSTSNSSSTNAFTVTMPGAVYHSVSGGSAITWDKVTYAELTLKGSSKKVVDPEFSMGTDAGTKSKSVTVKELTSILKDICDGSSDDVTITAAPKEEKGSTADSYVAASETMKVYRVKLDRSGGATYSVKVGSTELISTSDTTEYFYAIKGLNYSIKSTAKNSGEKFQKWDNDNNKNWDTADGGEFEADGSKTFKAIYSNSSSSSPSSSSPSTTGRNAGTAGEGMDDYDDVPKTGESKADIWILWSVLFVSILGAGFMIWKRFGLVRAIAEADEEVAVAEHKEEVKAKKKEKEDKIKMLKDLRNL